MNLITSNSIHKVSNMFFALLGIATLFFPLEIHAARQKVCVTEEGKVVIKRKCSARKNLTPLDLTQLASTIQGPKGDAGDQGLRGDTGPSGTIAVLQGSFDAPATLLTTTGTQKYYNLVTFEKIEDDSLIKITASSNGTLYAESSGEHVCNYQIRIDDKDTKGNSGNFDPTSAAYATIWTSTDSTTMNAPLSIVGAFPGLAAGMHTVSIYVELGDGANCGLNEAWNKFNVIIEEIVPR